MSMLSSCTLLSLAPAPGKFSPGSLQLRTKQPTASSAAAALPWATPYKVSRAPRLVCHAQTYNIVPTALVHPSSGIQGKWKTTDDEDRIILEFNVGEGTKEGELSVTTTKDQALTVWLVIRYKGDRSDGSLVTSLDAHLQMPPGYDKNNVMKAEILSNGWLQIIINKPKPQTDDIKVTKQS
ncbi:unnamed protein product [Urochloa decumbens]|uniref:SHSP domain-containing protein n=1 Tax=Urochloa decumbens TaxID=240449 RepID=A0ABC9GYS8_9POAL